MEELKRVQELRIDEFSRRRLIENQDTINELTARIQELQNEVNCMNDSRDFNDAQSARSGPSHFPGQLALFPSYRDPGGLLSRNNQPPDIWNSQVISGNVVANPRVSFRHFREDTLVLTSTGGPVTCGERQIPDTVLNPRFQTGPSAGNSFDLCEGRFSNNYGADQQRLQISELHFDKFPTPTTFACWKIRFNTEVCTGSHSAAEAMLWIKEVELVDSVDDLKSSCSVRGIHMPNFEVLDAKIASALSRIIHNTKFKRKVSPEERPKRGPFPSWKTDCLLDLRILPGHWGQ